MQKLKALNKKETKEILKQIEEQWGASVDLDLAFLENNNDRIFLMNKELSSLDTSRLRINSLGLYFCEKVKGFLRLSIEGSQLVGPKATKSVIELDKKDVGKWLMGEDKDIKQEGKGFYLIKSGSDYMGCGFLKDNLLKNYVGKNRRVSALHD